eukprot:scaffold26543_cov101-Isochrysis_galbana.AAC.1
MLRVEPHRMPSSSGSLAAEAPVRALARAPTSPASLSCPESSDHRFPHCAAAAGRDRADLEALALTGADSTLTRPFLAGSKLSVKFSSSSSSLSSSDLAALRRRAGAFLRFSSLACGSTAALPPVPPVAESAAGASTASPRRAASSVSYSSSAVRNSARAALRVRVTMPTKVAYTSSSVRVSAYVRSSSASLRTDRSVCCRALIQKATSRWCATSSDAANRAHSLSTIASHCRSL